MQAGRKGGKNGWSTGLSYQAITCQEGDRRCELSKFEGDKRRRGGERHRAPSRARRICLENRATSRRPIMRVMLATTRAALLPTA